MRKSKQTSFDRSLYSSTDETIRFHSMICEMFEHLKSSVSEYVSMTRLVGIEAVNVMVEYFRVREVMYIQIGSSP